MTVNHDEIAKKNQRVFFRVMLIVLFMVGLSFAAVPLYDVFCRVTGFGGTTQYAQEYPDQILEREMTVLFNADTGRNMPWDFKPEERSVKIKVGDRGLTNYIAHNPKDLPVTGTAIYNVIPQKAGKYFHKVQCFCFDEQLLPPGERMNMPVMFFIDPAINDDKSMDDVDTITLSYTFFRAESEDLDKALEEFYNQKEISTPEGYDYDNQSGS